MKTAKAPLKSTLSILSALSLATVAPIGAAEHAEHAGHGHHHHGKHHPMHSVKELVAVVQSTEGNQAKGLVQFVDKGDAGVAIRAEFSGLTPNAKHAIHIHEFGDVRGPQGKMAGGHYNPEGLDHGLPETEKRHAGDLGNLQADADGRAVLELTVKNITLVGAKNPIVGRSIIVHAGEDDGGQPTGNAGARIAQGVIGIAKQEG